MSPLPLLSLDNLLPESSAPTRASVLPASGTCGYAARPPAQMPRPRAPLTLDLAPDLLHLLFRLSRSHCLPGRAMALSVPLAPAWAHTQHIHTKYITHTRTLRPFPSDARDGRFPLKEHSAGAESSSRRRSVSSSAVLCHRPSFCPAAGLTGKPTPSFLLSQPLGTGDRLRLPPRCQASAGAQPPSEVRGRGGDFLLTPQNLHTLLGSLCTWIISQTLPFPKVTPSLAPHVLLMGIDLAHASLTGSPGSSHPEPTISCFHAWGPNNSEEPGLNLRISHCHSMPRPECYL